MMDGDSTACSFFLSPEPLEDSFYLSRCGGGLVLEDGWTERFRVVSDELVAEPRAPAIAADAARMCVQDVSIRSLCAALDHLTPQPEASEPDTVAEARTPQPELRTPQPELRTPQPELRTPQPEASEVQTEREAVATDLGVEVQTELEAMASLEVPAERAVELHDAPAPSGGRRSEPAWSLEELSTCASEAVRGEVRRPTRPLVARPSAERSAERPVRPAERSAERPVRPAPRVEALPEPPPMPLACDPAEPAEIGGWVQVSPREERARPPPLDVAFPEEEEPKAPTHYFFGEHGWLPVQVVELEMPLELAQQGCQYGYYSVVQQGDNLEVGSEVPSQHVYAVPPPEPARTPARTPSPSSASVSETPSVTQASAVSAKPPTPSGSSQGPRGRVRAHRGKRPEQGRARRKPAENNIIVFGSVKPSFSSVAATAEQSLFDWDEPKPPPHCGRPTPDTRPSTTATTEVGRGSALGWGWGDGGPMTPQPQPMTPQPQPGRWVEQGAPPDDSDSEEEEAARREMAEVEAAFELYPFQQPAAGGGGQMRSLRMLQGLRK